MNSEIVKFVAGGGKTTYSIDYLSRNDNGLYLAFTRSVVNEVRNTGYLSKTIDSFFSAYIIPKFIHVIPLIANGSEIKYIPRVEDLAKKFLGVRNIHIDPEDGCILNKSRYTNISLNSNRRELLANRKNIKYIRFLFNEHSLYLTDILRNGLSQYILLHFPEQVINFVKERFTYVIVDEAQDLNGYKELFVKLLEQSDIKTIILGDDNQNIMGGAGGWFESKTPTRFENRSRRSPEPICWWIRENLGIEIYGDEQLAGSYHQIKIHQVLDYDNGDRFLLYNAKVGKYKEIIDSWSGPKNTIKMAKGSTIEQDIVIVGKTLNKKNLYTALTRTKGGAYSTVNVLE